MVVLLPVLLWPWQAPRHGKCSTVAFAVPSEEDGDPPGTRGRGHGRWGWWLVQADGCARTVEWS